MNKRFRLGNHIICLIAERIGRLFSRNRPSPNLARSLPEAEADKILLCGSAGDLTKVDNSRQVPNGREAGDLGRGLISVEQGPWITTGFTY